jgi:hypothetical protein
MGGGNEPCIAPLLHDKRFAAQAWQSWPFSVAYQSFLPIRSKKPDLKLVLA